MLPKGEILVQQNQVVSSLYILKEGLLKIVLPQDAYNRKSSKHSRRSPMSADDIAAMEYLSASDHTEKPITTKQRRTSAEVARTGILKPGSSVGVTGEHGLEFWPMTIAAVVPCTFMVLDQVDDESEGRQRIEKNNCCKNIIETCCVCREG